MSEFMASIVADQVASPAARFTLLGRVAAAATVVIGASFQVVAFALIPDFDETADRLRWIADNSTRAEVSKTFDLLAVPFLIGAVIVYVLLAREQSPRLAWTGGILLGLGMSGLMAVQGYETLEYALVADGRFNLTALADVADEFSYTPVIAMGLLFIVGAISGIVIISLALWRSRAVPRIAPVLFVAFLIIDLFFFTPLIAHIIALVGAIIIAASILEPRRGPA